MTTSLQPPLTPTRVPLPLSASATFLNQNNFTPSHNIPPLFHRDTPPHLHRYDSQRYYDPNSHAYNHQPRRPIFPQPDFYQVPYYPPYNHVPFYPHPPHYQQQQQQQQQPQHQNPVAVPSFPV